MRLVVTILDWAALEDFQDLLIKIPLSQKGQSSKRVGKEEAPAPSISIR